MLYRYYNKDRENNGKDEVISMFDIIIIGAGNAGLSAAIYATSRGKKVLVLEKAAIGGLIRKVSNVTHFLGAETGESGESYCRKLERLVERLHIDVAYEAVTAVDLVGDVKTVTTAKGTYQARRIIIANGTTGRDLPVVGREKLAGKGYGLNAVLHGEAYRGKHVYVIGAGDGAIKEAIYLAGLAEKVTILCAGAHLDCIAEFAGKIAATENAEILYDTELVRVSGEDRVESLELRDMRTGTTRTVEDRGCGIFTYAGTVPNTGLYTQLKLENGYIPVDDDMQTEIEGVFAVGDIRVKDVRQISTAVSDGTIAGIKACR